MKPELLIAAGILSSALLAASSHGTEPNTLSSEEKESGWLLLFDGRSLDGWRASESADSFRVEGGAIVAEGPRAHLYYVGTAQDGEFVDFEFTAEVKTSPGANSGVYFHTRWQAEGWPALGYEVQINNSDPPGAAAPANASRSGSLWGVADLAQAVVPDGEWFHLGIRVEGKKIVTTINGESIVDYTEPLVLVRPEHLAGKALSSGTFALQAADPASRTLFRSIKVRTPTGAPAREAPGAPGAVGGFGRDAVAARTFRMHWQQGAQQGVMGEVTLKADGMIDGSPSEHESRWRIDESGNLAFLGRSGNVTAVFDGQHLSDGQWILSGSSKFAEGVLFRLDEKLSLPKVLDDESLNRIIRPWSKQEVVGLDPGESCHFTTRDGRQRTIRLVSVSESRDSVVQLVRKAEVRVEIDEEPLDLVCAPYVMPTEIDGVRIQADITSGMVPELAKQVSLSLWDANDPIVDTAAFQFPLVGHRLFSHDLQAYGEVVWLGVHDGDPKGVTARHAYGIDLAGYEYETEVLAVADGVVHDVFPGTEDPYAALIRSENGVVWEYGHLHSLLPEIREGASVRAGQAIGRLGRRGHSGNFSHLHLGLHPSPAHRTAVVRTQRLNFYPWIVAAYRARQPQSLIAIAGAHQVLRAGETATFDASHSMAFDAEIVSHRWLFHDGETAETARAAKTYREPGVYVAELWVEDGEGRTDVDFCRVTVFPIKGSTEGLATVFLTHTPTMGIEPGHEVTVRGWVQGEQEAPIALDFGDGSPPVDYRSYAEAGHRFEKPGHYVVTATAMVDGFPVMAKQKILVTADGALDVEARTPEAGSAPAAGMAESSGSSVGAIVVGAGRRADGSLVNPGQSLPEGLETISADIELRNLAKGEGVQVWVEQGENQTEPIDAVIEGEGSGMLPFDLHVGDAAFPEGAYTLVVMVGERKRFTQDFEIGATAFRSVTHAEYALQFDLSSDWKEAVGEREILLTPVDDHPHVGQAWVNIRVFPKEPAESESAVANAMGELMQRLPAVEVDQMRHMLVHGDGEEITDAEQIAEAGDAFDPRTIRLSTIVDLHFDAPAAGARWRGLLIGIIPTSEEARFEYLFLLASRADLWEEFEPVFDRLLGAGVGFDPVP